MKIRTLLLSAALLMSAPAMADEYIDCDDVEYLRRAANHTEAASDNICEYVTNVCRTAPMICSISQNMCQSSRETHNQMKVLWRKGLEVCS
jgi:hypothetical protein